MSLTAQSYLALFGVDIETRDRSIDELPSLELLATIRGMGDRATRILATDGWMLRLGEAVQAGDVLPAAYIARLDEVTPDGAATRALDRVLALRGLVLEDPYSATKGAVAAKIVITREQREQMDARVPGSASVSHDDGDEA